MESIFKNGLASFRNAPSFPDLVPSRDYIWSLAAIKYAASRTNAELGFLETTQADALASAALEVMDGWWDEQIFTEPIGSGPTGYHRKVVDIIADRAVQILVGQQGAFANRVHIEAGIDVHQNQPAGEVISTILQLGCLKSLEELQQALRDLTAIGGSFTDGWPEPVPIFWSKVYPGRSFTPATEYQELLHDVFYRVEGLSSAADALRYVSLEGPVHSDLELETKAKMVKRLADVTGLNLYPSDHSSHSVQFLAEIDAFSMALRAVLTSLKRVSDQANRRNCFATEGLGPLASRSNAKLDEVTFRLQVCDLIVALAAQIELQAMPVMLPILAFLLFEAEHGLAEAASLLSTGLHDELANCLKDLGNLSVGNEIPRNYELGPDLY
jgi:fumarate hydratase class II